LVLASQQFWCIRWISAKRFWTDGLASTTCWLQLAKFIVVCWENRKQLAGFSADSFFLVAQTINTFRQTQGVHVSEIDSYHVEFVIWKQKIISVALELFEV